MTDIDTITPVVNGNFDPRECVFTRRYADTSPLRPIWESHPVNHKTKAGVFVRPNNCRFPVRLSRYHLYTNGCAISRQGWVFYSEAGMAAFEENS